MTDKEKYDKYLEIIGGAKKLTRRAIGEELGFGDFKRPDTQLAKFIKKYEHNKEDNTQHNTDIEPVKQDVKSNGLSLITQNFFNQEENINILVELVEAHKKKDDIEEIEIIDTQLSPKYRGQKNEQKSIRVNNKLFKDWDRVVKKNPNFKGLTQAQILNFIFFESLERYK